MAVAEVPGNAVPGVMSYDALAAWRRCLFLVV